MRTQLYLISPPELDEGAFAPKLDAAIRAGGAAAFQLRLKGASDAEILEAAKALIPICRRQDCAFILNDRADLAKACGADGVHLGREDGSLKQARAALGKDAIIGATCHNSRHYAIEAGERGASYVAFGAFHPTATKAPPAMAEPEILTWCAQVLTLPSVAIGGITAETAPDLVRAGADFIAVSSYIWGHDNGPAHAARAMKQAIDGA